MLYCPNKCQSNVPTRTHAHEHGHAHTNTHTHFSLGTKSKRKWPFCPSCEIFSVQRVSSCQTCARRRTRSSSLSCIYLFFPLLWLSGRDKARSSPGAAAGGTSNSAALARFAPDWQSRKGTFINTTHTNIITMCHVGSPTFPFPPGFPPGCAQIVFSGSDVLHTCSTVLALSCRSSTC